MTQKIYLFLTTINTTNNNDNNNINNHNFINIMYIWQIALFCSAFVAVMSFLTISCVFEKTQAMILAGNDYKFWSYVSLECIQNVMLCDKDKGVYIQNNINISAKSLFFSH